MNDLREQQLQYELDSDAAAAAARLSELQEAAANGDVSLPKATRFIARAHLDVKNSIIMACSAKARGTGAKFLKWLRAIDPSIAAVIALRECISQLTNGTVRKRPVTIQVIAGAIGRLYELEIRIKEAQAVNPVYMKKIHDQVKERGTTAQHHLAGVYGNAYNQVMKEHADSRLDATETIQLGKFGLAACQDAGLVTLVKAHGDKGSMFYYMLEPEIEDFLMDYSDADVRSVRDVNAGAMMCPPDPWESLTGGGYLSARRKQWSPLMSLHGVRKSERARLREEFTAEKMPKVFQCANYLQSIPLTLHAPTVSALTALWHEGGGVMGIPTKNAPTKPVCPLPSWWVKTEGTEEELKAFHLWKREATLWHESLRGWRSKAREIGGFLRTTAQTSGPIWMPVFCDTRGRWYYRSNPNPQGSDIAKSSLHFYDKKPLGKRGLYWLKVSIANNFGYDKVRFDARAAWTDENWSLIKAALLEPANKSDVWGNDAPWCMFSAAYELNMALLSGDPEGYCTGIPVHMDATCSGLQHFSAILMDQIGGRFVNLYDCDPEFLGPKQDIYSKVGSETIKVVEADLQHEDEDVRVYAALWLKWEISRTLAKTPVMTYVYGATLQGTAEFVQDHIEGLLGTSCWPADVSGYKCSMYLARRLFQGIGRTVPASEAAMHWLKGVARAVPRGKRMEWTTPTGFKVQHDYQGFDELRVEVRSCGVRTALVREFNDTTIPLRMQNAIAPNFVHALDASHLTLVALEMERLGLQMVAIHDSFGTHPSDVDKMHEIIRDEFYKMYKDGTILEKFLWEVDSVGEGPQRGTLDLSLVKQSEFFFC